MSSTIESVLTESRVFPPSPEMVRQANISGMDAYASCATKPTATSRASGRSSRARSCCGTSRSRKTLDESNAPFYKWFDDGELNASYNCLDRHLENAAGQGRDHLRGRRRQGHEDHLQGALPRGLPLRQRAEGAGLKKGDRVLVYMPMSIQAVVAMQACARIGATHSVVFGGFSAKCIQERIVDAGAVAVITADGQFRGGTRDPAEGGRRRSAGDGRMRRHHRRHRLQAHGRQDRDAGAARDVWWHDAVANAAGHVRADVGERRASAVHPLHVGIDRQAEGRAAFAPAAICCRRS